MRVIDHIQPSDRFEAALIVRNAPPGAHTTIVRHDGDGKPYLSGSTPVSTPFADYWVIVETWPHPQAWEPSKHYICFRQERHAREWWDVVTRIHKDHTP